jgi:UDP-N-acetylmuramyl pentapeptide phosphotransferase/UDP-N-acetylglucosamine-1-phosphate transferase
MNLHLIIMLGLLSLVVSAVMTWRLSRPKSKLYLLDYPNERSLHERPTPRTGGIAIVCSILFSGTIMAVSVDTGSTLLLWSGFSTLLLGATSFIDDRFGLPFGYRLAVHVIVAAALVFGGFVIENFALPGLQWSLPRALAVAITLLYVAWMVNLYNFMDGMDGFAGGMALIGFGTFAVFGFLAGHYVFAGLNLIVACAAAGFLLFNFPPARIFMGDTGSSCLGLLAAAFSIWGAQQNVFPFWGALLVFSPFIVDATVTLARRLVRGERVWLAHRTHYYQRLVQLGWGHRRTVLWEYGLMFGCVVTAMGVLHAPALWQWLALGLWGSIYSAAAAMVARLERRAGAPARARKV